MTNRDLEVTKLMSRELVSRYWPEQLAVFDEYWPYYEQQPDTQPRKGGQGGAESWVYSPYVAGLVTTIVGHLVITHTPRLIGAVKQTVAGFRKELRNYYESHPQHFARVKDACARIIGDHPLFDEVVARLEDYLQISEKSEDERSQRSTDQKRDS